MEAVHSVISGIFEEVIDDQKLEANPIKGLLKKILPPKKQRDLKDADPFTRKERDLFLAQAESTCSWTEQLTLKVMAHAGLRLGEALAMRRKNVDFEKMTYLVTESYQISIHGGGKMWSGRGPFGQKNCIIIGIKICTKIHSPRC